MGNRLSGTRNPEKKDKKPKRWIALEDSDPFGAVPDEIVVTIGGNLGAPDLVRVLLLSRRFSLDHGPMKVMHLP